MGESVAVQIIPLIKALGPYVTAIATSAIPAFTSKSDASKGEALTAVQIRELQDAVTKNAQSLHVLAEQLQKVVASADEAARAANRQVSFYKALVLISTVLSVGALAAVVFG